MGLRSTIGRSIHLLRMEKKKTQEEVSKEGGISRKHFADIEKGVKMVSVDILLKIARGLEISLIDLLNRVEYEGIKSFAKPESLLPQMIELKTEAKNSLYYQGEVLLVDSPKRITIIGTKTPSEIGIIACKEITKWFVERDYVIVSGLAKGIDTVVHQTCLENNGKAISVLPSGIRNIFPPENSDLAEKIVKSGGLLLTEYPDHSSPKPKYYEDSNKILASLGLGVIVIEPQVGCVTWETALYTLKHKKHLACIVTNHKRTNNYKMRGTSQLIKEHKEVFIMYFDNLNEFEGKINSVESNI